VSPIFVDTSGLCAVIDRDDANHPRAVSVWPELVNECSLITNDYVLVETAALLQFRLGIAAVRGLQKAFCFDAHFREQGFETIP